MKKIKMKLAVEDYLYHSRLRLKPNSYRSLENRITNHILPYFEKKSVNKITKIDYVNWQTKINETTFSTTYKKSLHICFLTFLNHCIKYYDLENNVAKQVGNFKCNEYEKKGNIWTIDEFNQFIDTVDNDIYKGLFNLLFFTGLRIGEALALTFNDIDENCDTITVNKNMTRFIDKNGNHVIVNPKSKTSVRTISIDSVLKNELLNLRNNYHDVDNDSLIFGNKKPLSTTTIERKKNQYCCQAHVKQIKIHEFRHSHACLLFMNNVPIDEISYRLGHSTLSMTMDIYLKYLPKKEKRVIETLNSLRLSP